jgi:hypothetical protein
MKKIMMILAIMFMAGQFFGQTTMTWYFGNKAGLKFLTNGTTVPADGSAMYSGEGCTAITDKDGILMFYSDGDTVWDNKNSIVFKGLFGGPSATHAALAVPIPGTECQKFLIFTLRGVEDDTKPQCLGVALVEVTGIAPDYNVRVDKPCSIVNPEGKRILSEKLAATSDNQGGFWVFAHDFIKQVNGVANTFYKYNITKDIFSGVASSDEACLKLKEIQVIQSIGANHNYASSDDPGFDAQGQMKFSKDGTQLALVLAGSKTVELFGVNLDPISPTTPAYLTLKATTKVNPSNGNMYGCEFSPNGKLLYTCESYALYGNPKRNLYQWDIQFGNLNDNTVVVSDINHFPSDHNYKYNALQLGPNDLIYCSEELGVKYLSVIKYPDIKGSCGWSSLSVPIANKNLNGLPTVMTNFGCGTPPTSSCSCKEKTTIGPIKVIEQGAGTAEVIMTLNSGSIIAKNIMITWSTFNIKPIHPDCKTYCELEPINMGMFDKIPEFHGFTGKMVPEDHGYSHTLLLTTSSPRQISNEQIVLSLRFPTISTLPCCWANYSGSFTVAFVDENCNPCATVISTESISHQEAKPVGKNEPTVDLQIPEMKQLMFNEQVQNDNNALHVYPNPNDGTFKINTASIGSNLRYEIKSNSGVIISSGTIKGTEETIHLNLVSKAPYLVSVYQNGKVYTQKVVIQ